MWKEFTNLYIINNKYMMLGYLFCVTAPSRGPQNVTAERLNITAVLINWTLLNLVEARGFVQHYVITYTPTAVSAGSRINNKRQDRTVTVDGSANSGRVSDLEAGVAYEVTVHAVNMENGQLLVGPPSDPVLGKVIVKQ